MEENLDLLSRFTTNSGDRREELKRLYKSKQDLQELADSRLTRCGDLESQVTRLKGECSQLTTESKEYRQSYFGAKSELDECRKEIEQIICQMSMAREEIGKEASTLRAQYRTINAKFESLTEQNRYSERELEKARMR